METARQQNVISVLLYFAARSCVQKVTTNFLDLNGLFCHSARRWLISAHAKYASSCHTLKRLQGRSDLTPSQALFAAGVVKMAKLRKSKAPNVAQLMTRPPDLGLELTKAELTVVEALVEAFEDAEESFSKERLEDAVGVLAINGVTARPSRLE